jgi:hypothetical protein
MKADQLKLKKIYIIDYIYTYKTPEALGTKEKGKERGQINEIV